MKASVIITTYNAESYIRESIDSILNQNFTDFRLFVIDDGSTDRTVEIIRTTDHPKLKFIELPVNCGMVTARNLGIKLGETSDYIVTMDADDISHKDRLSKQIGFLDQNKNVDILGSRIQIFNEQGVNLVSTFQHPTEDAEIKSRLLLLNGTAMSHPSSVIRTKFLKDNLLLYPHPSRGNLGVDHDFWISCIPCRVSFRSLEEVLLFKRRHKNNISAASAKSGFLASRKTVSRARLLSYFYPLLTMEELTSLATLFEEGKNLTFEELALGFSSTKAALRDMKSYFGESKQILSELLKGALKKRLERGLV
jgi:glycosyltransferase involved in cell wall biosynthesis